MKIALLGSAPSSLGLAPFGQPGWSVWGCSPGVYYQCGQPNAWFELHRWEPPVIGNPAKQKTWFSPEYVAWMAMREPGACPVWMYEPVPQIPASRALPADDLVQKYGSFFFTSSIAWMIACAIEDILEDREAWKKANPTMVRGIEDEIALYGVDMAANEEYGYQRAGCQHFLLIAADLDIKITVPPESDLLRPMPLYGIDESSHWMIKYTTRLQEHQSRIAFAQQQIAAGQRSQAFLEGAMDELKYQMQTWGGDRTGMGMTPTIMAKMPRVRAAALQQHAEDRPPVIQKEKVPLETTSLSIGHGNPPTAFGHAKVKAPKKKAKRKR